MEKDIKLTQEEMDRLVRFFALLMEIDQRNKRSKQEPPERDKKMTKKRSIYSKTLHSNPIVKNVAKEESWDSSSNSMHNS